MSAMSTIKKWISKNTFRSGVNGKYIQQLIIEAVTMTFTKYRFSLYDEISLENVLKQPQKFDPVEVFEFVGVNL